MIKDCHSIFSERCCDALTIIYILDKLREKLRLMVSSGQKKCDLMAQTDRFQLITDDKM